MARLLRDEDAGGHLRHRIDRRLRTRKLWRIQVIAEIETYRPNRRLVAQPAAQRMRKIVEITARSSGGDFALLPALLAYAKHAGKDVVGPGKHVAGIVKDYWTEILLEEGQRKRRHAQLKLIQKESVASHWETGLQIARPSLVEREPAQADG